MSVITRNRAIKKALSSVYGAKSVSVTNGSGTAYGWLHIKVTMPKTSEHNCAEFEGFRSRCTKCYEEQRAEENKIKDIARNISKENGERIYTYSSDDGYGSDNECMLVDIEVI